MMLFFQKKLIFDMKNWFSGKKNLIFGFPVISSLMLKKNFIENGKKMTKLEAFCERSLIEQPNIVTLAPISTLKHLRNEDWNTWSNFSSTNGESFRKPFPFIFAKEMQSIMRIFIATLYSFDHNMHLNKMVAEKHTRFP